jgi:hypothetical protein
MEQLNLSQALLSWPMASFNFFTDTGEIVLAKPTPDGFEIISRFESPGFPTVNAYAHPVIYQGDLFVRINDFVWRYNIAK